MDAPEPSRSRPESISKLSSKGGSVHTTDYGTLEAQSRSGAAFNKASEEEEPTPLRTSKLHRGLSARQVQMIAIAGTIGTGLFLGTGRSLAKGGPASILICYCVVGFVVYVTLLLLGEMATQYPVAGSFNAYATRFFSPSYGFALSWNYWFNDAVSVASDLTAAQLLLQYWTPWHSWVISLLFWVFLVGINAIHVRAYGELGVLTFMNNAFSMLIPFQNIGLLHSKLLPLLSSFLLALSSTLE
jgi:amino acid transporter, AAT family